MPVRNLKTQYDFYSHQCSTFYAKPKKPTAPGKDSISKKSKRKPFTGVFIFVESVAAADDDEVAAVDESTLEENPENQSLEDAEERKMSIASERRKVRIFGIGVINTAQCVAILPVLYAHW